MVKPTKIKQVIQLVSKLYSIGIYLPKKERHEIIRWTFPSRGHGGQPQQLLSAG